MIYKNLTINIQIIGQGKPIIFLHGWGQSGDTFINIANALSSDYTSYLIDLPGFGESDEPDRDYVLTDYTELLESVIKTYCIENPLIIGHSFGGRVAIKHANLFQTSSKLILISSAGLVPKRTWKYYYKVYSYKTVKWISKLWFLKKYRAKLLDNYGSPDYKNASERMRKVLVNVVNEDLTSHLKQIDIPVLLYWGESDQVTPISSAYRMKELLKDCGLVKVNQSGHFAYLEQPYQLIEIIKAFY